MRVDLVGQLLEHLTGRVDFQRLVLLRTRGLADVSMCRSAVLGLPAYWVLEDSLKQFTT